MLLRRTRGKKESVPSPWVVVCGVSCLPPGMFPRASTFLFSFFTALRRENIRHSMKVLTDWLTQRSCACGRISHVFISHDARKEASRHLVKVSNGFSAPHREADAAVCGFLADVELGRAAPNMTPPSPSARVRSLCSPTRRTA